MTRRPLQSSNLRSAGYDAATKVLEVEFQDGAVYRYTAVPAAVYRGLMGAASPGGYLHRSIVGRYAYARVEDA